MAECRQGLKPVERHGYQLPQLFVLEATARLVNTVNMLLCQCASTVVSNLVSATNDFVTTQRG